MKRILKIDTLTIGLCNIYAFLAPFTVCNVFEKLLGFGIPTSVLISVIVNIFSVIYFCYYKKLYITKESLKFIIAFYVPVFISTFLVIFNLLWVNESIQYAQYLSAGFISRSVNLLLCLNVFLFCMNVLEKSDQKQRETFIKSYLYGIMVLVIFGVWQWTSFYLGVPYLDIETRSDMHSLGSAIEDIVVKNRVTSLAAEPSFLVPLLIDGIILGYFLEKNLKAYIIKFLAPIIFVLFFTYSLGGFVNLFILLFILLLIQTKMLKKYGLLLCGIAICSIIIANYYLEEYDYLLPIIAKVTSFNIDDDIRAFMTTKPFLWAFDHTFLNALFGHGPGSYKFLELTKILPDGHAVHTTSNNLFSDAIYETGFIGFIFAVFYFLWLSIDNYIKSKMNKQYIVTFLLTAHLIISSFYRADYTSPRFFCIIIIIITLRKLFSEEKKRGNYES